MLKLRPIKLAQMLHVRTILSDKLLDYNPKITDHFSNFDKLTQHRCEQAKRTALFEFDLDHDRAFLTSILQQLDKNEAKVDRVFYHINQKYNSLLVEFESMQSINIFTQTRPKSYLSRESNETLLNGRCFYCKEYLSESIVSKEKLDYLKRIASKLIHIEVKHIREQSTNGNLSLKHLFPNDLESQIKESYEMKKINELGIRIRYFVASLLSEKISLLCLPSRGSFSLIAKFDHDLDLAIELSLEENNSKKIVEFLLGLLQKLQNLDDLNELRYFYKGVQLLKFKHHILYSNLDIHISFNSINNRQSYLMTKLLWTYSVLNMNFVYLMSFFRHWAREMNIIDTPLKQDASLNFFIIQLLVLHFLINFNLLPSMDELIIRNAGKTGVGEAYDIRSPLEIRQLTNASPDLIKCILGFFAFYSNFDFTRNKVTFVTQDREIDRLTQLRRRPFIEQPFVRGANVAFKVDMSEVDDFKRKCFVSFQILKHDSNLVTCLSDIKKACSPSNNS